MAKPEARLTENLNKGIRALGIYAWKISDKFTTGVLDTWYSGNKADLWVEYKWDPEPPKYAPIRPGLSEKQKDWIMGRHSEGRSVAVIIGTPLGCIIYPGLAYQKPKCRTDVTFYTKKEVIDWIHKKVEHNEQGTTPHT